MPTETKAVHSVPAAVAAAISTGRRELLFLGDISTLPPEAVRGIYGILGDLIEENVALRARVTRLDAGVRETIDDLREMMGSLNLIIANLASVKEDD